MRLRQKAVFTVFVLSCICGALAAPSAVNAAEISLYRPETGVWYSTSADGSGSFRAEKWGAAGDVPVPGDYDGDGLEDLAVWRPKTGEWLINRSSDAREITIRWGASAAKMTSRDIPVPADYDGDGVTDIAVWHPADGVWHILLSSTGFDAAKAVKSQFGRPGDVPIPADYDGDGKADLAMFRPSENSWNILESKTGQTRTEFFGLAGDDILVPGDYTGDGRTDIAVYRRGTWLVLVSETGKVDRFEFGSADAIPVPKDLDGDGIIDFAFFENGTWYIYYSAVPRFLSFRFGQKGDLPLATLRTRPGISSEP